MPTAVKLLDATVIPFFAEKPAQEKKTAAITVPFTQRIRSKGAQNVPGWKYKDAYYFDTPLNGSAVLLSG